MSENRDPKETVLLEELLMGNVYMQEALINLLKKKGLLTEKELLEEIDKLKRQWIEQNNTFFF